MILLQPLAVIQLINSIWNSRKSNILLEYRVSVKLVVWCNWKEVGKKGGGGEAGYKGRGMWANFHLELFLRITFPCPWLQLKKQSLPVPTLGVVISDVPLLFTTVSFLVVLGDSVSDMVSAFSPEIKITLLSYFILNR